jgi:DNA-directed RNA polymerase specialized sigma24 family protein
LSTVDLVRRALGARTPEQCKAAFTDIADRYRLVVFRQCARWFPHPEEAQSVCQAAFEAALTLLAAGKAPEQPDKLAGWLIEIARRRGQEYRRKDISAGVSWAIPPRAEPG